MTRLLPFWTALLILGALVLGLLASPILAHAEGPDLYEVWAQEAAGNGDPVTPLAYAEHVARLGDPRLLIRHTWGAHGDYAIVIAACESSLTARAVNPRSGASGLFQVMRIHEGRMRRLGYTWGQILDPVVNVAVAYDLWSEQGWRPWECSRIGGW